MAQDLVQELVRDEILKFGTSGFWMAVEVEREIEKLVYNNKLSNAFLGVVDNDTPQFSY